LESGPRRPSTVLFRFAAPGVAHQQAPVVLDQRPAEVVLALLVDVLGVVRDDAFRDRGPDGVYLSRNASPLDADADIEVAELVLSDDEDRFEYLQPERLRFDVLDRLAVYLDQAASLLGKRHGRGSFLPVRKKTKENETKSGAKGNNRLDETLLVFFSRAMLLDSETGLRIVQRAKTSSFFATAKTTRCFPFLVSETKYNTQEETETGPIHSVLFHKTELLRICRKQIANKRQQIRRPTRRENRSTTASTLYIAGYIRVLASFASIVPSFDCIEPLLVALQRLLL